MVARVARQRGGLGRQLGHLLVAAREFVLPPLHVDGAVPRNRERQGLGRHPLLLAVLGAADVAAAEEDVHRNRWGRSAVYDGDTPRANSLRPAASLGTGAASRAARQASGVALFEINARK